MNLIYTMYIRICQGKRKKNRQPRRRAFVKTIHPCSFLNDAIRGAVDQCTFVYTGQRQVFLTKNLLLFGTTAVRGGRGTADIKPSHE